VKVCFFITRPLFPKPVWEKIVFYCVFPGFSRRNWDLF